MTVKLIPKFTTGLDLSLIFEWAISCRHVCIQLYVQLSNKCNPRNSQAAILRDGASLHFTARPRRTESCK